METMWIVTPSSASSSPTENNGIYTTQISTTQISRPRTPWKLSSALSCLPPLQETTGVLQTQLREAQQELEQGTERHRDDLAALREEGRALLQDKIDLQKQVPPSSQPHSPSPASPGSPTPSCRTRGTLVLLPELGRGRAGLSTEWKIEGRSELSTCLSEPWIAISL